MAFETTEKLKLWTNKTFKTEEVSIGAKIQASLVSKVLAVSAKPMIKGFEQVGTELNTNGRISINVVFKDVNGAVDSASSIVDFNQSIKIEGEGQYFVFAKEVQTVVDGLTEKEISINSTVELLVEKMQAEEVSFLKPGNENCFEKIKKVEVQTLQTIANEKFSVVEEFEIDADKILATDAAVIQKSVSSFSDGFLLDGEIDASLLVVKDGQLKNIFKKFQFTQEVAALGAKPSLISTGKLFLNSFTHSVVDSDDKNIATIAFSIGFVGFGYVSQEIDTVEDLYSEKNEIIVSRQGFDLKFARGIETTVKSETLTLSTKDKSVSFGNVVGITDLNVSNTHALEKDGNNSSEQFIQCTVLYKHSETDELMSVVIGAPIVTPSVLKTASKSFEICALKSFSKKKVKEIEIDIDIIQTKIVEEEKYEYFVSSAERGGEIEESTFAVTVYAAQKGQTIFEIAKALQVAPNVVVMQNQNLPEVLNEPRKIVLYRQSNANFN